jgi:hypothetical protein
MRESLSRNKSIRWVAWREGLQVVPNRAPGVVLLWHACIPDSINLLVCGESIPPDVTILRYTGQRPNGMVCTECLVVVDPEIV